MSAIHSAFMTIGKLTKQNITHSDIFAKSLPSRSFEDENSYHSGDGDPVLQKDLSVDLKAIRGK